MFKLIENGGTLSPGSALHLSCYMTLSPHPLTLVLLSRNEWISNCDCLTAILKSARFYRSHQEQIGVVTGKIQLLQALELEILL